MNWRDFGAVEFLSETAPEGVVAAFAALTHLGDTAVFFVVLALVYWFGDRRRGAYLLGVALGGLALVVALKGLFGLPRPPTEFQAVVEEGYGFPSGHALGSTVVWGLLALELDVGTRRQRTAAAAGLIVGISLSRVVVGVHYLGDVFAGVVVGLAYLAVATRAARGDPHRAFAVASVVAVAALATSGPGPDAVMAAGGVLGGWLAWTAADVPVQRREERDRGGRSSVRASRDERPVSRVAAVGLPAAATTLAVLGAVAYLAETAVGSLPVLLAVGVVVPAGIVLLPTVHERVVGERVGATR